MMSPDALTLIVPAVVQLDCLMVPFTSRAWAGAVLLAPMPMLPTKEDTPPATYKERGLV